MISLLRGGGNVAGREGKSGLEQSSGAVEEMVFYPQAPSMWVALTQDSCTGWKQENATFLGLDLMRLLAYQL